MILTKCFAAILLVELFFAAKPFASCLPLATLVQETKLLLTYSGWKDILENVKTITAEGAFGDDDVAKLVEQNENINTENILDLVNHIFLMLNCRYSSRLLFLSIIINDLAIECGYLAGTFQKLQYPSSQLTFCEKTILSAFELTSKDSTHAISALLYFHKLHSKKLTSRDIRSINKPLKYNYNLLLSFHQRSLSPALIRFQLKSTVNSLKTFNENLIEYCIKNCRVETAYNDLRIIYLLKLKELKHQSNSEKLLQYLHTKVVEVSNDISDNNFKHCGFLYNTDTEMCTLRQP